MATISGYMICYNEENIVKISVENMLQFVDELIISDGESTDKTTEILVNLSKQYSSIKLFPMTQHLYRDRTFQYREHYSVGFNEIERRNYAISKCTGDYILAKDIDELYHENTEFHNIIKSGKMSYHETLYEVISSTEYLPHVRIKAIHSVPKLIRNTGELRFVPSDLNTDIGNRGIDCCLAMGNRKSDQYGGVVGAFDRWHYKMIFAKTCYEAYRHMVRSILPAYPKEHDAMINLSWFCRE